MKTEVERLIEAASPEVRESPKFGRYVAYVSALGRLLRAVEVGETNESNLYEDFRHFNKLSSIQSGFEGMEKASNSILALKDFIKNIKGYVPDVPLERQPKKFKKEFEWVQKALEQADKNIQEQYRALCKKEQVVAAIEFVRYRGLDNIGTVLINNIIDMPKKEKEKGLLTEKAVMLLSLMKKLFDANRIICPGERVTLEHYKYFNSKKILCRTIERPIRRYGVELFEKTVLDPEYTEWEIRSKKGEELLIGETLEEIKDFLATLSDEEFKSINKIIKRGIKTTGGEITRAEKNMEKARREIVAKWGKNKNKKD